MKNKQIKIGIAIAICFTSLFFSDYAKASDEGFSYLLDAYLTKEKLDYLTKTQLNLLRNEIYATHGYIFKSEKLRDYFQKQQWYKEKKSFSPEEITIAEKALVRLIKEYEQNEHTLQSIIIGKWVLNFPFGSGHSEIYEFQKTGDFVFTDYDNTSEIHGKWKTEEYDLFIKLNNSDWILVCDTRSYNEYWYPKRKELGYPPKISIKPIKNAKVANYVHSYFKIPANY